MGLGACRNGGHEPVTFLPRRSEALAMAASSSHPLAGLARIPLLFQLCFRARGQPTAAGSCSSSQV